MGNISEIIQSPTFAKQKKKLKKNQIKKLDEAIKTIIANPDIGDLKKGDLQGIMAYKYKVGNNLILLAYEIESSTLYLYSFGSHQNFYRELSKYLHH
ncbi:MAG: type II toxin-antitoxin system RelE/ParE family toxin [Desulfosalsimonadaceae bacterium]|nr:type II toxin-antitoxin system RelE/ParE family toxin [Desulfosalsimonadaceae bacterium]